MAKQTNVVVDSGRVATKGLKWLDPVADKKEIDAIPFTSVVVTHSLIGSRGQTIKRDNYSAVIHFDNLICRFTFPLNDSQFGLIMLAQGKAWIANQSAIQCRVRPVKTLFPAKDGNPEKVSHSIEVMLCDDVILSAYVDDKEHADFLKLFEKMLVQNKAFGEKWTWFVRTSGENEKPEVEENKKEDLPFNK